MFSGNGIPFRNFGKFRPISLNFGRNLLNFEFENEIYRKIPKFRIPVISGNEKFSEISAKFSRNCYPCWLQAVAGAARQGESKDAGRDKATGRLHPGTGEAWGFLKKITGAGRPGCACVCGRRWPCLFPYHSYPTRFPRKKSHMYGVLNEVYL